MKQSTLWKVISTIIWLAQLAAEALAAVTVWRLDILPGKYFALLIALFLLASLLTGLLLFLQKKRRKGKPGYYCRSTEPGLFRRIVACILALVIGAGCVFVSTAVSKLHDTMAAITKPTVVSSTMAVYILAEDPAQTLADAGDYTFAVTDTYDAENTQKAVAAIQDALGRNITTVNCDNVIAMIDALYEQSAGAIILNEAYVGILEDIETYSDFSGKTRILYEIPIMEPEEAPNDSGLTENSPENGVNAGSNDSANTEVFLKTPFVMYLSGSDTRSQMLTTSRSDVNILIVVNPETKQVLLVNTPRDYYVPNPAGGGALDKLTHCGVYGIQCSVDALAGLYDVPIDYYAQINFTGFETLIDAIGGITVYSDVAFTAGGNSYQVGNNELNGSQALAFARERYAFAAGDNVRGQNQMKVIKAVIAKLSGGTILANYSSIMDSLQGMFITNMSTEKITQLVKMQLSDMAQWNVQSYAVTGDGGSEITYSMPGLYAYVMYPHQDTVENASSLIQRVLAGESLTEEDVKPIR